jgi:hypothetical protein
VAGRLLLLVTDSQTHSVLHITIPRGNTFVRWMGMLLATRTVHASRYGARVHTYRLQSCSPAVIMISSAHTQQQQRRQEQQSLVVLHGCHTREGKKKKGADCVEVEYDPTWT